jgi:hypothetical protein
MIIEIPRRYRLHCVAPQYSVRLYFLLHAEQTLDMVGKFVQKRCQNKVFEGIS